MDGKHLTANERFYIERRLGEEKSLRQIASELGVAPSTVSNAQIQLPIRHPDY